MAGCYTATLTRWRSGVRVSSCLPFISLNPLSRERQFPSELAQLVTIGHQIRKIFDCLPLRCGNRDCVKFEGSGHLRVTQLRLRLSQRCSRVLQERGVSSAQRMPVEPGRPKLAACRFQVLVQQVRVAERGAIAGLKNQMLSRYRFLAKTH